MANASYYNNEPEEYTRRRRSPSGDRASAAHSNPQDDYMSSRERMTLDAPLVHARPRSVPPHADTAMIPRAHSRSGSRASWDEDEEDEDRPRSHHRHHDEERGAVSRARKVVDDNFSHSAAGIGAGLLGAVVGGLVARQASEAANRHRRHNDGRPSSSDMDDRTRAISTVLGAVAGGLGANAIANRVESSRGRERDERRQEQWDHDHRRHGVGQVPREAPFGPVRMLDRDRSVYEVDSEEEDKEWDHVYDDRRGSRRHRSEESFHSSRR